MIDLPPLCRELVTLPGFTFPSGSLVRDPERAEGIDWTFRRLDNGWVGSEIGNVIEDGRFARAKLTMFEPLRRAIAAGPDPNDRTTVGGLFMHYLPDAMLTLANGNRVACVLPWSPVHGAIIEEGATRTEAILRATLRVLKAAG